MVHGQCSIYVLSICQSGIYWQAVILAHGIVLIRIVPSDIMRVGFYNILLLPAYDAHFWQYM